MWVINNNTTDNTTYIAEKVARWSSGHRRATELLAITAGEGKPRVSLHIRLPDRTVTAEIASKSLRKAQTAIRTTGADNLVLMLQGRLAAGDVIAEVGLSAQPKAARPPQAPRCARQPR